MCVLFFIANDIVSAVQRILSTTVGLAHSWDNSDYFGLSFATISKLDGDDVPNAL